MSLTPFIPDVVSHTFSKVGAVCVSEVYYTANNAKSAKIVKSRGSLLAIANKYGLVAWTPPGVEGSDNEGLWLGDSTLILNSIELDRAAAEEEAAEKGQEVGKQQDLPIDTKFAKNIQITKVSNEARI